MTEVCYLRSGTVGLQEPGLKEEYYQRSGTVSAPGATFKRRVLLMVRERFTPRAISGKKMDINGLGPFWLQESVFKVFA